MQSLFSNALSSLFSQHLPLSASRRETLAWLVVLIMRQGTVCLWRLAAHVETHAALASVQRRFYRFFQHVHLDGALTARIVVALLSLDGKPWTLTIDRTNWFFGRVSINILMIAVDWRGVGIPLLWTLLPTCGNSDTATRINLLDRLSEVFPNMRLAALIGDREFIGDAWMASLETRNIPFVLRLKDTQLIRRDNFPTRPVWAIARRLQRGSKLILKQPCRLGLKPHTPPVRIIMLRLQSGELVILAANTKPKAALKRYRQRWRIECLFANLKSRGFDLEATHLTNPAKLETLIACLAIAVALAAKSGAAAQAKTPIPFKAHGRKAASLFALGLKTICKALASPSRFTAESFLRQLLTRAAPQANPKPSHA
jgi:DDE family transposase